MLLFVQGNSFSKQLQAELSIKISSSADGVPLRLHMLEIRNMRD